MDKKGAEFLSLEGLGAKSSAVAQQNPSLVVINPSIPIPIQLGPVSQILKCPYCEIMMESRIEKRITKQTHLFALALCLTGLICLVPLPYCLKSCQSADHFCSQCNRFLGAANF